MAFVRAKFLVLSKETTEWGVNITLGPVYGDSPENKQFFSATPAGSINLFIVNPTAAAALEVNKEYYIDFTPVEERG
jgi:hypothetical protein